MLANSVRTIPITVAQASVVVFWVVLSFIKGTFNAVKNFIEILIKPLKRAVL